VLDRARRAVELLDRAALLWASSEQRLPLDEVTVDPADRHQLDEVLRRMNLGRLTAALDSPPARLVPVHATLGKRLRAGPVAVAVETGRVSHVGVLPELEQELTSWSEGMASPGRLDAYVWLVTRLLAAHRSRSSSAAHESIPTGPRR
jgi:phage terminase large subunit-like protein